jgi:hypothetical protein
MFNDKYVFIMSNFTLTISFPELCSVMWYYLWLYAYVPAIHVPAISLGQSSDRYNKE